MYSIFLIEYRLLLHLVLYVEYPHKESIGPSSSGKTMAFGAIIPQVRILSEKYWTHNPLLRIFYGLSNILGVIFVLGMVGYLTFTEHWWYLGVYVGGLILAKLIALLLRLLLYPLYRLTNDIPTFAEIKVQRIVGSLMVLVGIVLFFCLK